MPDQITPSTTESSPPPSTEQTPATAPLDADSEFGVPDNLDESAIFADLDEAPPAPVEAPAAKQPAQPVQPKPEAPVAPPPEAPTAPAAPTQPTQPEVTAEQVMESFRNWRQTAEGVLANSHYNLSKEDADALNIDAGQVIPKLMARVYLDAVTAAVNVISQSLPQTVMSTIEAHNGYKQNESEFFSEWPGLKDHYAEVLRVGQVFRHLNPSASKADFVRSVGAQVAMALGLNAEQARGIKAPAQTGQRVLRHIPPAASARHPMVPARPQNIFEQMSGEEDE
jgi:hypothetical protein